jgi:hypothetical protein
VPSCPAKEEQNTCSSVCSKEGVKMVLWMPRAPRRPGHQCGKKALEGVKMVPNSCACCAHSNASKPARAAPTPRHRRQLPAMIIDSRHPALDPATPTQRSPSLLGLSAANDADPHARRRHLRGRGAGARAAGSHRGRAVGGPVRAAGSGAQDHGHGRGGPEGLQVRARWPWQFRKPLAGSLEIDREGPPRHRSLGQQGRQARAGAPRRPASTLHLTTT